MRPCPRCYEPKLRDPQVMNALSRHGLGYICSDCGVCEAMIDAGYMTDERETLPAIQL